ncbi:MAG: cupin domain-containing protein [Synergistales bacterium]|nr:cupin domain-containing protein [Synergistales bacterium]
MDEKTREAEGQPQLAGRIADLPLKDSQSLGGGTEKRIVFGPDRFFEDYVVRFFTLPPRAHIDTHGHHWPHYLISLHGHGQVVIDGEPRDLPADSWAHVPPHAPHAYDNLGDDPWSFLCIVPCEGDPHGKMARYRVDKRRSAGA